MGILLLALLLSFSVERWVATSLQLMVVGGAVRRGSKGVINVYPAYLEVFLGAQQTGQASEKEGTRREVIRGFTREYGRHKFVIVILS